MKFYCSAVFASSLLGSIRVKKPLLSGGILSYTSTMMALSYLEIDFYYIEDVYGLNDTLLRLAKIGSCGFESLFECL